MRAEMPQGNTEKHVDTHRMSREVTGKHVDTCRIAGRSTRRCTGVGGMSKENTEKHVDTCRTSREDTRKHVDTCGVEIKHKVMGLGKWRGVMWIW